MARERNRIPSQDLKISTTPKVMDYLEALVDEQLYGKSKSEVAEGLIREAIRRLIEKGELKPTPTL